MAIKKKYQNNPAIQKLLAEAWLNISIDENRLGNPLNWPPDCDDEPYKYISWLMTQPEYFSFICKEILNVQLMPFQLVILKELWQRKFPMLIAARGAGKALAPDTPIRIKNGWKKIKDIEIGDKVYGSDGKLANVIGTTFQQKDLNFYRITLRDGRQIECCEDHMWKVWDKYKTKRWCELSTKDMINNYCIIRQGEKSNGKEYRYALPINQPLIEEDKKDLLLHPYILGVLLGDGCITQKRTIISSHDIEIINKVSKLLPRGYKIVSVPSSNKDYSIIRDAAIGRHPITNKWLIDPFYKLLQKIGIWGLNSETKFIPDIYKYGSVEQKTELMYGLMDTDGSSSDKHRSIEYYTISNNLSNDFLEIARSLGFACKHKIRESWFNGKRYKDCNRISIYTNKPVFTLKRKLNYVNRIISKQGQSKYEKTFIVDIEYIGKKDGYCIQVDNDDKTYITKDYVVTHNSFILAIYALLRALLIPKRKIVIAGAAFRQSKIIFEYMESIYNNAPLLKDIIGTTGKNGPNHEPDMYRFNINESRVLCIPIGTGEKIRGLRAADLIMDEFSAVSQEIFEVVLAGFTMVSASPFENVKKKAAEKLAKKMGIYDHSATPLENEIMENQIVMSGTAYYDFNHFAKYWKDWHEIISTKGEEKKIKQYFTRKSQEDGKDDIEIPDAFNWRDYSIIRIPFDMIPEGQMDAGQIARSKATLHSGQFEMEMGAVFSKDSKGFYKRSLIESCIASPTNVEKDNWPKWCPMIFEAQLHGHPHRRYIYGIDPASETDNFSIVILELHENHQRVVYGWVTNRESHKKLVTDGLIDEYDYYAFCAKKIRMLMRRFPCERLMLDAQGGGIAVMEALHDKDKYDIDNGEEAIWPIVDPDKPSDYDSQVGLHILELVNFADAKWVGEANHGMRYDMEHKILLFPFFDPVTLAGAIGKDKLKSREYDTLEECVLDIEELKDELSTIIMSQTATGKDKWDTPEVKLPGNKKGRLRKDRYSALLMANMGARQLMRQFKVPYEGAVGGGFAGKTLVDDSPAYIGNDVFSKWAESFYG